MPNPNPKPKRQSLETGQSLDSNYMVVKEPKGGDKLYFCIYHHPSMLLLQSTEPPIFPSFEAAQAAGWDWVDDPWDGKAGWVCPTCLAKRGEGGEDA